MATYITQDCINCDACVPACPNGAIRAGPEIFVIDPALCTECVGVHHMEKCQEVCPVDCCLPDPARPESEADLLARAKRLHPDQAFPDDFPSRFRPRP